MRIPFSSMLLKEQNLAADDALATALSCASPRIGHAIVRTLLARNQAGGLAGLIEQFHQLDDAGRQLVVDDSDLVYRALRESFTSKEDRVRLNVLEVIREARLYRASYLLEAGLHDRLPKVREVAADAFRTLADALLSSEPKPPDIDTIALLEVAEQRVLMGDLESRLEDRRQLASALATGLACFNSHLQPKIVEAAMWLVDDLGIRFWTCITAPSSRALHAAVHVLEQSTLPRLVPFAIEALAHSELRPHVLRILAARCDVEFMTEWLTQGWRLTEPRLARTMNAVRELACLEERGSALLQMQHAAERHLPRWIRLTGLSSEKRAFVLKELYRRGGTELRRSVVTALIESFDERALSLLRVIASERETECAQVVRLELSRRFPAQYPPGDLLPSAPMSTAAPHVRPEAPYTLERYWNEFETLDNEQRMQLGARVIARNPRAWAVLNRQLSSAEPGSRLRALKIVSTLGMATSFADQLYSLSYDPQPEVRSAAVLALGQVPGSTTRRILQQALIDPDDRVQANAVEAAEETGEIPPEALLEKLASPDNRVRANAVKALLKLGVREAAETLMRMLQDPDRRQRASALWLVDKMGLFAVTRRIVQMSTTDQDEQLRRRAADVCERLKSTGPVPAEVPT